jgi:hypothetical protein
MRGGGRRGQKTMDFPSFRDGRNGSGRLDWCKNPPMGTSLVISGRSTSWNSFHDDRNSWVENIRGGNIYDIDLSMPSMLLFENIRY